MARQSRGGGERWVPQGVPESGAPGAEDSQGAHEDEPDTDEWLVPGADKAKKAPRKSRRTSTPKSTRAGKRAAPEPPEADEPRAAEPPAGADEAGSDAELSSLRERLAEAEARAGAAEDSIGAAEDRIAEAESRAAEAESRAAEAESRVEQAESRVAQETKRQRESSQGSDEALAELRESHEAELSELREAHEVELVELRESHERELAELRAAQRRLEQRLAEAESAAEQPERADEHQVSTTQRAKSRVSSGERLDINTVGFEDLRELGLSVAQSARLIATRDVRMGFESLKELDDLPDLPSDVVSTLKQRLQI